MAFVLAALLEMASNNPNHRLRRSILAPSPNQNHQTISGTCINDVPDHLMIEIFSSIPTKQAIKLKLISKKWCRIISSRLFARAHLSKTPVHFIGKQMNASWPPRCLRLIKLKGIGTEEYENDLERMIKLSPTLHLRNVFFTLVNSCDGLLCLAGKPPNSTHEIFISNPILREIVKLPKPQAFDHDVSHVALGYNPRSDEYKVIKTTFRQFFDEVNGLNHQKWVAEIYTLGNLTLEWRYLGDTEWPLPDNSSGEFLNGCLHWTDETCLQALRRFSFVKEEFNTMKAPSRYGERDYKVVGRVNVAVLNTSLCVSNYVQQFESLDVWTMREYGKEDTWVMMYRIRTGEGLNLYGPLAISENGFVVFHIRESRFILLQPETEFFYPAFTAIDGTHIKAPLPRAEEIPYIGCKGYPTQNVLVVVDFNVFHLCLDRMGRRSA
ncbi:F-box domain [Dillenia turbinata]|uniref:F-box domain n=1 Tax=Dillenia turbinata TaxID=194707 RepID=A0AAN8VLK2_9MAGN